MTIDSLPLVGSAVFALLGAVALWRSGRGRSAAGPIGGDSVCGRCGYDRFGLAAGAACPECGGPADLATIRQRRVSRWKMAVGVVAVLTAAGLALPQTRTAWRAADLFPMLPTVVLERLYVRADDANSRRAMRVLTSDRLPASRPTAGIAHLADLCTARMSTLKAAGQQWKLEIPVLYESLVAERAAGRISDASWDVFLRDAVDFSMVVRPVVGTGHPLPMKLTARESFPYVAALWTWHKMSVERIWMDGRLLRGEWELKYPANMGTDCYLGPRQPVRDSTETLLIPSRALNELRPGKHSARVEIRWRSDPIEKRTTTDSVDISRTLEMDFDVRDGAELGTRLEPNQDSEKRLREAFRIAGDLEQGHVGLILYPGKTSSDPVEQGSFDAFLVADGVRVPVDGVVRYSSASMWWSAQDLRISRRLPAGFRVREARLLLVPNLKEMEWETVQGDTMPFGEMELPIQW